MQALESRHKSELSTHFRGHERELEQLWTSYEKELERLRSKLKQEADQKVSTCTMCIHFQLNSL